MQFWFAMVVPKYLNSATLPVPISILFLWPNSPNHSEAASLLKFLVLPPSLSLSLSHTHTHTQKTRILLWTSDRPVPEAAIYTSLTHTNTTRRLLWTSDCPVPEATTYTSLSLSLSHTHTHTHTTHRLLWTSDRPVPEVTTYTTRTKHKRRTSLLLAGFEPGIPTI
jgi:hypothetical protein